MDWGDWGIVIGTLGLLAVLFVCFSIIYRRSEETAGEATETSAEQEKKTASDTKHAA